MMNKKRRRYLGQEVAGTSWCCLQPHSSYFTFLQEFERDAFDFRQKVEDIDRRLGTVFIQAFDDASDLEHAFKVCPSRPCSSVGGKSRCLWFASVKSRRGGRAGLELPAHGAGVCRWEWTGGQRRVELWGWSGLVMLLTKHEARELAAAGLPRALGVFLPFPLRHRQSRRLFRIRESSQRNYSNQAFGCQEFDSCLCLRVGGN